MKDGHHVVLPFQPTMEFFAMNRWLIEKDPKFEYEIERVGAGEVVHLYFASHVDAVECRLRFG